MATRKYVSDIEASYFKEHQLHCFNAPPETGVYAVGDVVISNSQLDDIFGWVCVEAGEPGVWEVIVDLSLIKAAIKALQEKDLLHDSLIETLRQRVESIYDQLTNEDREHREELDGLSGRIQNNVTNITNLTKLLNALGDNTSALENELRDLITNLTNKVNTNINNISSNTSGLDELKGKVQVNINNINVNKNDLTTLKNKVNTNTNNISELEKRVDDHDGDINDLLEMVNVNSANINVNKNDLTTLKNKVNTNTNNITSLTDTVNTNVDNILINTKSIAANVEDIEELREIINDLDIPEEVDLTDITKQISTNKNNISINMTDIADLENQMKNHNHDNTYAAKDHNHSGTYAAASHGNHVPSTQTANNAVFLRNDNSWQTVTPANIGAATSNHTHSGMLTFWVGTQAQYNALTTKESNMLYIITD